MDPKRDETSPTPEDKQNVNRSKGNTNVLEYNALQDDIDLHYATSHSEESHKPDKTSYKRKTLDTKASIKQENKPRTNAVAKISQNNRGVGEVVVIHLKLQFQVVQNNLC